MLSYPVSSVSSTLFVVLDIIRLTIAGAEDKIWSPCVIYTVHMIGQNIFLHNVFPNSHNICSSFRVRDQVLSPYKTEGKIMVSGILET
jgi:hypothetical protein